MFKATWLKKKEKYSWWEFIPFYVNCIYIVLVQESLHMGALESDQWLRALTVVLKDMVQFPAPSCQPATICYSSPGEPESLFWTLQSEGMYMAHRLTCRSNIYAYNF